MNRHSFSKRLDELMKEKGISNAVLAEVCETSDNSISAYRCGNVMPKLDIAYAMAKYMGVTLDYLVGDITVISITDFLNQAAAERKMAIQFTMQDYQVSFGSITKLHCVQSISRSRLYPRQENAEIVSAFLNVEQEIKDTYSVINGNVYREASLITSAETDQDHKYTRLDKSIYDYINEGNSLEPYIKAYETERYALGLIGILEPDDFFMLCYIFGFYQANAKEE